MFEGLYPIDLNKNKFKGLYTVIRILTMEQ